MKKNSILIVVLFAILVGLVSCEDYLDVSPERGIDTEDVYSEYYNFKEAVDRGNWLTMNYMANNTNWACLIGVMSDEQEAANPNNPSSARLNFGLWQDENFRDFGIDLRINNETSTAPGQIYTAPAGKSMKAIRAMGLCIENIDQLTDFPAETGYTADELRGQLLGQAYALRAWHWFEIIKRYGPIMMVDVSNGGRGTFTTDYNFDQVRPTWQQCADLIAADCDAAVENLPLMYNDDFDKGRITKATAHAIKATVLMWAASPLNNTNDGALPFGQDSYDEAYAKRAMEAMADCLRLVEGGQTRYRLYTAEEYEENWMSQTQSFSDEALYQPPTYQNQNNGVNQGNGWFQPQHDGGWGAYNVPTHNAAERFETINGYPINDFTSDDPAFDPANPYANRDPRLNVCIYSPGDEMYESDPGGGTNTTMELQAWDGGWHQSYVSGKNHIFTGYFDGGKWRKTGYNSYDNNYAQGYYRYWPHIRVSDMYLGLAELGNEVYGPTGSIAEATGLSVLTPEQALNKVRNRIGMPGILSQFLNTADFRNRVRNEWAVENYGEFRRFRDIRRWRIAPEVYAKGKYGVQITKNPDGTFTYVSKKLDVASVFEDKLYWYPFPLETVNMFAKFEQNPGW